MVADKEIVSDSRLIDVEILGHIFEQSINDLEKLQSELDKPVEVSTTTDVDEPNPKVNKRKRKGVLHQPSSAPILERLGVNTDGWVETVRPFGCWFKTAAGRRGSLARWTREEAKLGSTARAPLPSPFDNQVPY